MDQGRRGPALDRPAARRRAVLGRRTGHRPRRRVRQGRARLYAQRARRAHSAGGDTLVFKLVASGDARDLLDAGVDLLVTRDRALRDYGATLQNHAVVPLPWDRTYVYVTADPSSARFDGGGLEQSVRTEARRAEGGGWWLDLKACGIGGAPASSPLAATAQKRILYPRSDPTARELAGRLAALTHAVATGRALDDFSAALADRKSTRLNSSHVSISYAVFC